MPKKYGYCVYCGNVRNLTVDHVVPKSRTKQIIGVLLVQHKQVELQFTHIFVENRGIFRNPISIIKNDYSSNICMSLHVKQQYNFFL